MNIGGPEYGPVLVVGTGSIGRRHTRNLRMLGVRSIAACDSAPEQLRAAVTEFGVRPFADFDEALAAVQPAIVFVCTPPVFHIPQALRAVRAGSHVFIEKPLSNVLTGVDDLIAEAGARRRVVQIGYNLRFHPGLQAVKKALVEGTIGQVLWAQVEVGQYLPDWRPGQDHRQSYTAHRSLGGGIILDASHELDYPMWFLGQPCEVSCMAGRVSDVVLDVEDCATVLLRFPDGAQVDIHMDCVQRTPARRCKFVGQHGVIEWDFSSQDLRVYLASTQAWTVRSYPCEDNTMYVAELRHFLDAVRDGLPPLVDVMQAARVLSVALQAKAAASSGTVQEHTP